MGLLSIFDNLKFVIFESALLFGAAAQYVVPPIPVTTIENACGPFNKVPL